MHKTKDSLASLTSLPMRSAPAAKSGPRPLLLNSQTLITASKPLPAHSGGGTPAHRQGQWADVPLSTSHALRQESMSSISSLSLPDILNKSHPHNTGSRSDYNSDENSCSSESGLLSTLGRFASKFDPLGALFSDNVVCYVRCGNTFHTNNFHFIAISTREHIFDFGKTGVMLA